MLEPKPPAAFAFLLRNVAGSFNFGGGGTWSQFSRT
jgi:hypothetical protein